MNKLDEKADELKALLPDLYAIEENVITNYTLADAIREGTKVTTQAYSWGTGDTACALTSAVIAAKARGYAK